MNLSYLQNSSLVLIVDIATCSIQDFFAYLGEEELERLSRIKRPEAQNLFVVSHTLKRLVCSQYMAEPLDTLEFSENKYGKPHCTHPDAPYFNLSHSGNYVALALSLDAEVGVDIEFPRIADHLSIMQRVCDQKQFEYYLKSDNQEKAFLALWTQKEAVSKALGRGIAAGLSDISCSGRYGAQKLTFQGKAYHLQTCQLPNQGVLSCAADSIGDFQVFALDFNNIDIGPEVGDFMSNVLKSACKVI